MVMCRSNVQNNDFLTPFILFLFLKCNTSDASNVIISGDIISVKVSTAEIVISRANNGFPPAKSIVASVIMATYNIKFSVDK